MIGLLSKRMPSGDSVRYNKINITFPARVKVENIIPRNMIINLGCASVDNHIPRDDIFDYHPRRECNIYIYIYIKAMTKESLLKTPRPSQGV